MRENWHESVRHAKSWQRLQAPPPFLSIPSFLPFLISFFLSFLFFSSFFYVRVFSIQRTRLSRSLEEFTYMIYFIYIILPHSSLYLIRYYRLIIQIFSAIICRYEMMRSCWLENPLMRPTFAEITKRFQYYLREYKVLSWVFLCLIYWIPLSEITEQIYC